MTDENTTNTETAKLLETAQERLNQASQLVKELASSVQSSYEHNKENAAPNDSELKIILDTIIEKAGEATAYTKSAYEKAGGFEGISTTVASKAGEVAGAAHSIYDKVSSSETTNKIVEAAKNSEIGTKAVQHAHSLAAKFQESYQAAYSESSEK